MGDKPSVLRALRSHHMVILRLFSLLLRQTFLYSVICKGPLSICHCSELFMFP